MHAAETLYQGALLYHFYNQQVGNRTIEGTNYSWSIQNDEICVNYTVRQKEHVKCVADD